MKQTMFVLTNSGTHTQTTRAEFIFGMTSRCAKVEFIPSRRGAFEIVKIDGHAVATSFATESALMAAFAGRGNHGQ